MSRSNYSEDCGGWELIRWRGAVASALRGARGQAFLRELAAALDAMENKRLIREDLEYSGEVCALGALGRARGLDMSKIDSEYREQVASSFGIAEALAAEVMYINDDFLGERHSPESRFQAMRQWVASKITPAPMTREAPDA